MSAQLSTFDEDLDVEVVEFRPNKIKDSGLLGHVDVRVGDVTILSCVIIQSDSSLKFRLPQRPVVRDAVHLKNDAGYFRFEPMVRLDDDVYHSTSRQVLSHLREMGFLPKPQDLTKRRW